MEEYPVGYTGSSSATNFDYLLADVWWMLYPSGELPRYQVSQTPIGGQLLEYRASVFLTTTVPASVHSYNFKGGPGSTRIVPFSLLRWRASLDSASRKVRCSRI